MLSRQTAPQAQLLCYKRLPCALPARSAPQHRQARPRLSVRASRSDETEKDQPGLGLKAAWAAAEQYGNLVGGKREGQQSAQRKVRGHAACCARSSSGTSCTLATCVQHDWERLAVELLWTHDLEAAQIPPLISGLTSMPKHISREDAIASIKSDYESNYFVSGEGELAAYDPDCLFKDDFASFNGVGQYPDFA